MKKVIPLTERRGVTEMVIGVAGMNKCHYPLMGMLYI
jgi:hypothetical protein